MMKRIEGISWATIYIKCIVFLFLLPVGMMLYRSFSGVWPWPSLVSNTWTLKHWIHVFYKNQSTYSAVWTSVQIGVCAIIINLIIGIPAADALARRSFKGKMLIEALLFAPIIVPPLIVLTGLHITFIRWNFTEHLLGVVLAHLIPTLPYMVRALKVSYEQIGFDMENQAKVLGATTMYRFRYIVFPQILPGIIAGSGLTLLISLSQYIITVLIGGGQIVTIPLLMVPYVSGGDQGIGAVYALIFATVAIGLLFMLDMVLKRYYTKV